MAWHSTSSTRVRRLTNVVNNRSNAAGVKVAQRYVGQRTATDRAAGNPDAHRPTGLEAEITTTGKGPGMLANGTEQDSARWPRRQQPQQPLGSLRDAIGEKVIASAQASVARDGPGLGDTKPVP